METLSFQRDDPSVVCLLDDVITASVSVVRQVRFGAMGLLSKCLFLVTAGFCDQPGWEKSRRPQNRYTWVPSLVL